MTIASVFLLNQFIKALLLYSVQYLTGLLVKHKGVKVNYTRKINHFVLFLVPVYVDRAFAYEESFGYFSYEQFIVALIVVPILMTLTEAISPHTWDTPFIFLAGYLILFAISFV